MLDRTGWLGFVLAVGYLTVAVALVARSLGGAR